jgi:hypothetical protein
MYIWKFEPLNLWHYITKKLITRRSLNFNTLILSLQFWWCLHIISCGGFSQSLSPAEDRLSSWSCSLSTHLQFRFLSFSSWILGLRTINKLPIYAKPQTCKRISIQRQLYKHLFSASLCYNVFLKEVSSMTMFKLGVWEYDAVLNIIDKYLQEMVQGFSFKNWMAVCWSCADNGYSFERGYKLRKIGTRVKSFTCHLCYASGRMGTNEMDFWKHKLTLEGDSWAGATSCYCIVVSAELAKQNRMMVTIDFVPIYAISAHVSDHRWHMYIDCSTMKLPTKCGHCTIHAWQY